MYLRHSRLMMRPPLSPARCCVKAWASSSSGCSAASWRRRAAYASMAGLLGIWARQLSPR
jgi:hypothetical protein